MNLYCILYANQPWPYGPVIVKTAHVLAQSPANAALAFKEAFDPATLPDEAYLSRMDGQVHFLDTRNEEQFDPAQWNAWVRAQTVEHAIGGEIVPAPWWRIPLGHANTRRSETAVDGVGDSEAAFHTGEQTREDGSKSYGVYVGTGENRACIAETPSSATASALALALNEVRKRFLECRRDRDVSRFATQLADFMTRNAARARSYVSLAERFAGLETKECEEFS